MRPLTFCFLSILSVASLADSTEWHQEPGGKWQCAPAEWQGEPTLESGIFRASIAGDCVVVPTSSRGLKDFFDRLQAEYQTGQKYKLHREKRAEQREGYAGYFYDLTDTVEDGDSPVRIRQDLFIGLNEKKHLLFVSESTSIQATGQADCLKGVSLRVTAESNAGEQKFHLLNSVVVERPWYALAFLFFPISKGITEDKFQLTQQKLFTHFLATDQL